jgi:hypothetical protein
MLLGACIRFETPSEAPWRTLPPFRHRARLICRGGYLLEVDATLGFERDPEAFSCNVGPFIPFTSPRSFRVQGHTTPRLPTPPPPTTSSWRTPSSCLLVTLVLARMPYRFVLLLLFAGIVTHTFPSRCLHSSPLGRRKKEKIIYRWLCFFLKVNERFTPNLSQHSRRTNKK